ncbi:hypothetical protein BKI52_19130 [marine bacterium AO1-C]|nr:hypothetical protein BKI52_19130 [marine bacterium AO1-C]
MVWSYNTETNKKELRKVLKTFARTAHQLIYLHLSNQIIKTTAEHPFYLEGKWVKAGDLNRGDSLYLFHSRKIALDSFARVDTTLQVYNFSVAENHNYYAGKAGVLVHNASGYGNLDFKNLSGLPHLKVRKKFLNQELPRNYQKDILDIQFSDGTIEFIGKKPDELYAFIIKEDGTFKLGIYKQGVHYRLSDGAKQVRGAGTLKFDKDGNIIFIDNNSGHYLPTKRDNTDTVQSFYDNGYLPDESLPYLKDIDHSKDFPKDY